MDKNETMGIEIMSTIIIGIHGLGNKAPKPLLQKWWKKSIREGLKAIGYPVSCFNFKLVYWAHLLHAEPLNPNEKNPKSAVYLEDPYTPAEEIVRSKPSKIKRKILEYLEKQIDAIFFNRDKSINFSSITDLVIQHFFKDLDIYYTANCQDERHSHLAAKEVLRNELARLLRKFRHKKILLIAHSMGSIISYDVLTQTVPDVNIDTFVTIGSPLGLPIIMNKIYAEQNLPAKKDIKPRAPENISRRWYNLSDLEDKVAINYTLGDDYDENSKHITAIDKTIYNSYLINGKRNPHKVYGYLRAPEAAEIFHEFLTQDMNKLTRWMFNTINNIVSRGKSI